MRALAQAISERRATLRMSQLAVYESGGPSNTTIALLERALGPLPRATTLRRLDIGLRWRPGSARDVLQSGDPRVAVPLDPDQDDAPVGRERWTLTAPDGRFSISVLVPVGASIVDVTDALISQVRTLAAAHERRS